MLVTFCLTETFEMICHLGGLLFFTNKLFYDEVFIVILQHYHYLGTILTHCLKIING